MLPPMASSLDLTAECRTPFREPLQYIVMVSVTEETPYLIGLLAGVTVMTLMTLIYGLILDEGMRRYFVGSLTLST